MVTTSVFSLGNGLSSVEAWFATALDIDEVLSGVGGEQLHAADAYQVLLTPVDRSTLDCDSWFRKVYLAPHNQASI